jgi:hypothetical protein
VKTIWEWLPFNPSYPATKSRVRMALLLVIGVLTLAGVLLAVRRRREAVRLGEDFEIYVFSSLCWASYSLFLLLSYLFTSPTPDIDDRMLLPVYVCFVFASLAAFSCWQAAWLQGKRRLAGILPWTLALAFISWQSPQTLYHIANDHQGWGVTSYAARQSQVLPAARALPADQPVISNDAAMILLWADRQAYDLWTTLSPDFVAASGPYGSDPADPIQQAFCRDGAALVLVGSWEAQLEEVYGQAGRERVATLLAGLRPAGSYADGAIYTCRP